MNLRYDPRTDTLTLRIGATPIVESDEEKPGVILDYDAAGNLVGLEILDVSKRADDVRKVEFEVAS